MMTPEMIRFMRLEIARQVNVILSGTSGDNDSIETESINDLYPGYPQVADRPMMHPYGFASRAPAGTIQVTGRQGADAQNRMVLGHRDTLRKQLTLAEGESMIYASDGVTVLCTFKVSNEDGILIETENGFFQVSTNSDINFDTGTVKGTFGNGGTVVFKNQQAELIAAIIQLFNDVMTGTTATMLGPELLVMPTFATDILALQSFAGSPAGEE